MYIFIRVMYIIDMRDGEDVRQEMIISDILQRLDMNDSNSTTSHKISHCESDIMSLR